MSRACFDCGPDNLDDCAREECVPADGVPRAFLAVNRQLPGPAIQVCEGDRVVVDVYNELFSDSETIHWHGQHQRGSQYMDGVPFVTQCPILPGVFRYDMPYLNHGTYWYHSHSGLHRGDGVLGAMVVRRIEDQQAQYYDTDLLSHVLMVQDWTHKPMTAKYTGRHHGGMCTATWHFMQKLVWLPSSKLGPNFMYHPNLKISPLVEHSYQKLDKFRIFGTSE